MFQVRVHALPTHTARHVSLIIEILQLFGYVDDGPRGRCLLLDLGGTAAKLRRVDSGSLSILATCDLAFGLFFWSVSVSRAWCSLWLLKLTTAEFGCRGWFLLLPNHGCRNQARVGCSLNHGRGVAQGWFKGRPSPDHTRTRMGLGCGWLTCSLLL